MTTQLVSSCPGCNADLPGEALACPACAQLVHGPELARLAQAANASQEREQWTEALGSWRRALELLPYGSKQHAHVRRKVVELSRKVDDAPAPKHPPKLPKWIVSLGIAGLVLWKFKVVLLFVLTKGKLVLLGVTKWKTLLSMLVSLGVYWQLWGWPFALGFLASLYIHEMGHVATLARYGIRASAPMFVPGFGAFVRMEQRPATARENARVGMAGPWWGLAASLAAYGIYLANDAAIFAAIARSGAFLNMINLIPIWQLDGGRAFESLSRGQRVQCGVAILALWMLTGEPTLVFLLLVALIRCLTPSQPRESDPSGVAHYVAVLAGLAFLMEIHVPGT